MTLAEQCGTCADFERCARAYGKFQVYRAMGWRPEWKPVDGIDHPVLGCRWRVPKRDGADASDGAESQ